MTRLLWIAAVIAACGGGSDASQQVVQDDTTQSAPGDTVVADTMVVPDPPPGVAGRLALVATRDSNLTGNWGARAGRCVGTGRVRVLVDHRDFGVALLLAVPDSAPLERRYPVLPADSTLPQPPSARLGIHRFEERLVSAWQAVGGDVALSTLDRTVSGTFRVRIEELTNREQMFLAGTFRDLRVTALPERDCQTIGEVPDTTEAADTSGSVQAGGPVTFRPHGID